MMQLARRRWLPRLTPDRSLLPCIEVDDAASATVAALGRGNAGQIYDIVDDQPLSMSEIVTLVAEAAGAPAPRALPAWLPRLLMPYLASVLSVQLRLTNAKARSELGWAPAYRSSRDGLRGLRVRAA